MKVDGNETLPIILLDFTVWMGYFVYWNEIEPFQ